MTGATNTTPPWRPAAEAPRDATWIIGRYKGRFGNVYYRMVHWANGGGDDQPRFRGWFTWSGGDAGFHEVDAPDDWQPMPTTPPPVPEGVEDLVERLRAAAQAGREIVTEWDHDPHLWARAGEKNLAPAWDDTALLLANAYLRLRADVKDMEARKDAAYLERNQVVAALAAAYPSGIARTAIPGWSEDWHGCVYIDLPTGQASWHYHDSQARLFAHLPAYTKPWDGHTTEEKYERLADLPVQKATSGAPRGEATPSSSPESTGELVEALEIVDGFLECPEIADCAPEDKDIETDDLERRARALLSRFRRLATFSSADS